MEDIRNGTLSIAGVIGALVGAVVLSFLLYRAVGFPANIPLAFGSAVAFAEIIELMLGSGTDGLTPWTFAKTLVHGALAAGACWLGVWIADSLVWIG